jgi:hypothetical protein
MKCHNQPVADYRQICEAALSSSPPPRSSCLATAANTGLQPGFSRMAKVTVLQPPGHIIIVTGTAILAIADFNHVNFICAGAHDKTELAMANFAAKTDAMKPMRENYRAHIVRLGLLI